MTKERLMYRIQELARERNDIVKMFPFADQLNIGVICSLSSKIACLKCELKTINEMEVDDGPADDSECPVSIGNRDAIRPPNVAGADGLPDIAQ